MIIKSVYVENFRCIRSETLYCERLTALVGANGTGKSSFLRAIELFYDANSKYTEQDFYAGGTDKPIIIRVTFTDLTDQEKKLFEKHVFGEELTVEKEMCWPLARGSQKYYGASLRNPVFQPIRSAPSATEMRKQYEALQTQEQYATLPKWTKQADAPIALEVWESEHPDLCTRGRDDGQFFGFKEVGQAHLERFTRFLFIPAVRDASEDAAEGRGSVLTDLMDLVVRSTLAEREEIKKLRQDTQDRYREIVDPANLTELPTLQTQLSETLDTYVPGASVNLDWIVNDQIDIPLPKADIRLVEDGYASPVARAGHGLQRAFILTMLQHLAKAQIPLAAATPTDVEQGDGNSVLATPPQSVTTVMPNLILAVEEPELYQHPNRQRHLSSVLYSLAAGSIQGVAQNTQVLYATHSPLFVDIQHFHCVRLLRKQPPGDGGPKRTVVFQTTLDRVAAELEAAHGKPPGTYSGATLQPRLQTLMTPWMNEGFFAGIAVLVEGEDDRAAILGVARSKGYNLESMEISVIPCMGKNNLDRPCAIFRQLQIPVYVVWDGDYGDPEARAEDNRWLLCLMGAEPEDWPEGVRSDHACFKQNLEMTLRTELGEPLFRQILDECRCDLGFTKDKHAIKCPSVIQRIIDVARDAGKTSATMEDIVDRIVASRASYL